MFLTGLNTTFTHTEDILKYTQDITERIVTRFLWKMEECEFGVNPIHEVKCLYICIHFMVATKYFGYRLYMAYTYQFKDCFLKIFHKQQINLLASTSCSHPIFTIAKHAVNLISHHEQHSEGRPGPTFLLLFWVFWSTTGLKSQLSLHPK